MDAYDKLKKDTHIKEYTDLPATEEVIGYSLMQVNKLLRDSGAGSDIQYILENNEGNQVIITEYDSRFINENITNEIQHYDSYNSHVNYMATEENGNIIVKYYDKWLLFYYDVLEGNISEDESLELLNNLNKFTMDDNLRYELD